MFMHRGPGPRLDDYMHDSLVLGTVKLVTPGLVAAGVEPEKAKQACERAEAKLARLSEEALLREFVKWNATALKQTTDPMEAARLASIGNERASGALGPGAVRYVKIGSQTVYIVPEPVTGPEKKEQYLLLAYDESGAIAWDADITFFEEFEGGKRSKIPIIMQLIGTPYQYNGGKGVEHNQPVDAQAHSPQALCWQRLQNP